MKVVLVLAAVALATGNCFPGSRPTSSEDDVEILPLSRHHNNPFGIIDLDASDVNDEDFAGLDQGWRDSFSAFMRRIADLVKNVRTQVSKDFEDKLKNGNTTSTVEIIDGHKVIKNQTVYQDPHTYVKSVIFEVLPNDEDTANSPSNPQPEIDTELTVKKNKDREPLGDSVENEVNTLNEDENLNIETLDDSNMPTQHFAYKVDNIENNIDSFEIIEPESPKSIDFKSPFKKDTGNIEFLDSNEIPLTNGFKYNADDAFNDVESFESLKPVDLSNDTRINDMLQDQGYPMNPDAEIVDIDAPKLVVT